MPRCPSCGAHRDESDDYCPVCGETLAKTHFSEASARPWYERTGVLLLLLVLFWPAALYGVYRREHGTPASDGTILAGCLGMALLWGILL